MTLWPLFDHQPGLSEAFRTVTLRARISPVEPLHDVHPRLWIKRDDLNAEPIGGNKVRALEFLLGGYGPDERITTAGSRGSTHVLSTVLHARRLGLKIDAASWPQEMNDVARRVDERIDSEMSRHHFSNPAAAALWLVWRTVRGDTVIPPGGTSSLGILGHVNAALELAQQIRAGAAPEPDQVVVPLGTGGTAAGLAIGLRMAGMKTRVIAARVVPRIIGRASRVNRLIRQTLDFVARRSSRSWSFREWPTVTVADDAYGGRYGRPLAQAEEMRRELAASIHVDPTYSAKALVVAAASARTADTLFWLTFDSRWMAHE